MGLLDNLPAMPLAVFPNRVDIYSKVYTQGKEGGLKAQSVPRAAALPCSVQENSPALAQDLGVYQADADVVAIFPSDPGCATDEVIVQSDAVPPRTLRVVGQYPYGGLGLWWFVACKAKR